MSLNPKIQDSVIQQKSTITTPVEIRRTNEAPIIGDEMKRRFTQVSLDITPLPTNAKEKAAIKLMVAMAYPDVDIDAIDDLELQTKYYPQYLNGTLKKKCEALRPKIKETLDIIKKEKQDPAKVANDLLDKRLALQHEGFESLSRAKKEELRREEKLKFIKLIKPEAFINNTRKEENKALQEFTTTIEAFIYASQSGKLSTKEDFDAILKDPHRIGELQSEWAEAYFKERPERLEQLENSSNKRTKINRSERRMFDAYQRGNLEKAIAAANNMTREELYHSGQYTELKLAYLKEHASELNAFEKNELNILEEQSLKNGGDLSGIKNIAADINIDTSLTEQIIEADGVDIQDNEIQITNQEDLQKIAGYTQQIKTRLNECTTEDELKACIQDIRKHAQTDHEAKILDMMMNHIIAEFQENGNNTITPKFYINALREIGITPHMAVMTSATGNAETEKAYSDIVAKSEAMTNKQKAGYTANVTPEYQKDSQIYAVNTMTDTGIKEVHDVLPETYAKLDTEAAQKTFEHAMNSSAVSDEQKAIIARDSIDTTQNDDLKKFYQDLADKYKIDYNSVPPKSERVPSNKETSNETGSQKVENTNYSPKEITEILEQQQNNNILVVVGNGIKETVDIILGKTPDNNIQTNFASITSLNTAITQLQAGVKLSDVFRQSNTETKKELVAVICTYGKTAIAQLIDTFGGQTIYKLAKTDAAKALIKKELQRIALSDSTQRVELAEIKKSEEKDSLKAKA